ncbi:MAG: helix-turn-helix transcriptional regulator [Treponema sp.]|jgi:putative molybdopterin biosynthesis protein|nr:helix-turn-helix transcriptional regulator [Treponema sp.]
MEVNLLTAEDVARQLRIKKHTVYELIKRGELPSSKVGKQVRVSQSDIALYLEARKTGSPPLQDYAGDSFPEAALTPPEERARPASGKEEGGVPPRLIICGQDACIDLLLAKFNSTGETVLRSYMGSYNALVALYNGRIHLSASHLWDRETGSYNYPFIRRLLPGLPVGVIRLAGRMQGFYVQKGNPLGIRDWGDLAREGLRMINRERGCGTRILLDQKLSLLGINGAAIRGYTRECPSHLACAAAVAKGGADLGCGCERGAENFPGLEFIPQQLEWYDMVFPLANRNTQAVRILLSYINSGEFKQDLKLLGGYDTSQTGRYEEL